MHENAKPRVLYLDLEISPEFNATYGKNYEASVLHTELYQYIFCFAYKMNDEATRVVSLPDFPLYDTDPFNDVMVVQSLHAILSTADLVVCHNAKFDLNIARQRFIFHKLPPMKPVRSFCTLNWSRRNLHLNSNTLKDVALFFGVTNKMETSKNLWRKIHYTKDMKAWNEMVKYNKIDTIVCSQLYKIMSAWDGKAPPITLRSSCQNCGSDDVQYRGWTTQRKPRRHFVCKQCGRWGVV